MLFPLAIFSLFFIAGCDSYNVAMRVRDPWQVAVARLLRFTWCRKPRRRCYLRLTDIAFITPASNVVSFELRRDPSD